MGISNKKYQCSVCDNTENHSTNHFGKIYVDCKNCGNNGLECIEPEAIEARKNLPVIITRLHKYRFDISNSEEAQKYKKLYTGLKAKELKLFNCIDSHNYKYWDNLPDNIKLDTSHVFDNQWNSNVGRVFDWYEAIYPNRNIKQGYWLELTEEHAKVREPKKYACKTYYKGELLGADIITDINSSQASNQLYHKYFQQDMDIFKYSNEIELITPIQ